MLNDGDCIEYLTDVRAPVAQKGSKGERRIVGKTIGNYPANYLFRGGYIRKIEAEPVETKTIETEERRQDNGEDEGRTDKEGDYPENNNPETEAD